MRIGENDVFCRVKLLMVVADLPAKAAVLNCNQYNGKFGCSTCDHEGKQVIKLLFNRSSSIMLLGISLLGEKRTRINQSLPI